MTALFGLSTSLSLRTVTPRAAGAAVALFTSSGARADSARVASGPAGLKVGPSENKAVSGQRNQDQGSVKATSVFFIPLPSSNPHGRAAAGSGG